MERDSVHAFQQKDRIKHVQSHPSIAPHFSRGQRFRASGPPPTVSPSANFFENPVPGPGNYESMTCADIVNTNPSFSKKGYGGGFVSENERPIGISSTFENKGPGPGTYENIDKTNYMTSESFYFKQKSNQYRIQNGTVCNWNAYHKDLGRTTCTAKFNFERKVGPGTYEPKAKVTQNNPANMLQSKAYNDYMDTKKHVPPPGRYMISRAIQKKKPYRNPGPHSSFVGTVLQHKINLKDPQDMRKQLDMNLIGKKMITPEDLSKPKPGPGDYADTDAFEFMLDYRPENNKGLKAFIQDDHDRFGYNPDYEPLNVPGPGAYEIDLEGKETALVSGAAFLSESERQPFGVIKKTIPPNKYNPYKLPSKISFHFNPESKWI